MTTHTETDFQIYLSIRQIVDLVFTKLAKYDGTTVAGKGLSIWLEDRRSEGVNPFYGQTASGLFLELYYGLPSIIYTPWGKWGFAGGGSGFFEEFVQDLLVDLSPVSVHSSLIRTDMGEFGPVYAIKGAGLFRKREDFLPYETAHQIWSEMTERYTAVSK